MEITRKFEIDAGHRIFGHESKCQYLHGHRWVIEVTVTAPELDRLGRIIDFGALKEKVGGWLDANWDHCFILYEKDNFAVDSVTQINGRAHTYVLPYNPTCENLARYLHEIIVPRLLHDTGIETVKVVVWETPNSRAEAPGTWN